MIKIPLFRRQVDILSPSGTGVGQTFLQGLQERNQRNLLEIFNAARPILEEIAKVKPETWRTMSGLFKAMEGTFGTGIKAIGQGFLKPFQMVQNRAMNVMEGFLAPVMVAINNVSNQVESFALQNQMGATIGAGIGFIAGFILPGSNLLWAMIGGAVGAWYESIIRQGEDPTPWDPLGLRDAPGAITEAFQTSATVGPVPLDINITYQNRLTRGEFLIRQRR